MTVSPSCAVVVGATGGIGRAIARLLMATGVRVVAVGRDTERLHAVTRLDAGASRRLAVPVACDLGDSRQVTELAGRLADEHPDLDAVVYSAGAIALGPVSTTTAAEWDRMYEVNVRAPALLVGALAPTLRASRGHVVMVNSLAVAARRSNNGAYAATKTALAVVTEALRDELGGGVRVTSLLPGRTDTGMQDYVMEVEGRRLGPDQLLAPEDVARVAVGCLMDPRVDVTEVRLRPTSPPG